MIQSGEVLIILLLALVVLGPRRLPELARKVGGWTRELRAAAREITQGLEAEVKEIRDVGRELKAPLDDIKKPLKEIEGELAQAGRDWKGPKPVSGPTPEDAMRDLEKLQESGKEAEPEDPDGDS